MTSSLKTKFKFPKHQRYSNGENPYNQTREDHLCNKLFSSEKALDGHMRAHNSDPEKDNPSGNINDESFIVEMGKDSSLNINDESIVVEGVNDSRSDHPKPKNDIVCSLCGKNFPSMKSLFGHMRCHPERDWRGINPPASVKNSCSSSTASDSIVRKVDDQIDSATTTNRKALSSWTVKAKRGRRSLATVSSALNEDSVAVNNLLLLAQEKNFPIYQETEDFGFGYDPKLVRSEELEYLNVNLSRLVGKKKKTRMITDLGPTVYDANRIDNEDNLGAKVRFRCTTCHKYFSSHQALGGHRASHKKFKPTVPTAEADEITLGEDAYEQQALADLTYAEGSQESEDMSPTKAATSHQCKICNKSFPTGQALGGHKRCHWAGPAVSAAAAAAATEDVRIMEHRVHDFDLNELPMVKNGEELELFSAGTLGLDFMECPSSMLHSGT